MKWARALLAAGTGYARGRVATEREEYKRGEQAVARQLQERQMAERHAATQAEIYLQNMAEQRRAQQFTEQQGLRERQFEQGVAATEWAQDWQTGAPARAREQYTWEDEQRRAASQQRAGQFGESVQAGYRPPANLLASQLPARNILAAALGGEPSALPAERPGYVATPSIADVLGQRPQPLPTMGDVQKGALETAATQLPQPSIEQIGRETGGIPLRDEFGNIVDWRQPPKTQAQLLSEDMQLEAEGLKLEGLRIGSEILNDPQVGAWAKAEMQQQMDALDMATKQLDYELAVDPESGKVAQARLAVQQAVASIAQTQAGTRGMPPYFGAMGEYQAASLGLQQRGMDVAEARAEADRAGAAAKEAVAAGDKRSAAWQEMAAEYYASKAKIGADPNIELSADMMIDTIRGIAHRHTSESAEAAQMADWMYEEFNSRPISDVKLPTKGVSAASAPTGAPRALGAAPGAKEIIAAYKGAPGGEHQCATTTKHVHGFGNVKVTDARTMATSKTLMPGLGYARVMDAEAPQVGDIFTWPSIPGSMGKKHGHSATYIGNGQVYSNFNGVRRVHNLADVRDWGSPVIWQKTRGASVPAPRTRAIAPPGAGQLPRSKPSAKTAFEGAVGSANARAAGRKPPGKPFRESSPFGEW